jgi:hypothetical protein
LTGTRSDDSIETTGIELIVQEGIDGRSSGTSSDLLFDTLGLLLSGNFLLYFIIYVNKR